MLRHSFEIGICALLKLCLRALSLQDADGVSVGARSWPHHNISTFDNVSALMNAGGEGTDNGVYREGVRVEEVMNDVPRKIHGWA